MIRALLGLALLTSVAAADAPAKAKKDLAREGKSTRGGAVPVVGSRPVKLVNFYNTWTHEWLAVDPTRPPPNKTRDRFLRDHYTNTPTQTEPKLIDMALAAAQEFRSDVVMVVSAFRHPKYNLILRKKGHQVARDSNHTKGNAIDFYIPRVPTMRLHAWAKDQKLGGVGLYMDSGFVHMDTGRVRYWSGE